MKLKQTFLALLVALAASGCQILGEQQQAVEQSAVSAQQQFGQNPYAQNPYNSQNAYQQNPYSQDPYAQNPNNLPAQTTQNPFVPAAQVNTNTSSAPVTQTAQSLTCAQQGKLTDPMALVGSCFGVRAPEEYQSLAKAVELFTQRGISGLQAAVQGLGGNPRFIEVGLTAADTPTSLSELRAAGENKLFVSIQTDTGKQYFNEQ